MSSRGNLKVWIMPAHMRAHFRRAHRCVTYKSINILKNNNFIKVYIILAMKIKNLKYYFK